MNKPKIKITLIDRKGESPCHYGHQIGDSFDFDLDRGKLCPLAMHIAFIYADILRYGGEFKSETNPHKISFCCPDTKTINIFQVEIVDDK